MDQKGVSTTTWTNNEAEMCDFSLRDLKKIASKKNECRKECIITDMCTHYVWSDYGGGLCWLKNGTITKKEAFKVINKSNICGIVTEGNVKNISQLIII